VVVVVGVVCSVLGWVAASAFAAPVTYTVATTTDGAPGSCTGTVCPTLRDAVTAANLNPGSTIQLSAASYQLSVSALPISKDMTIEGQGPALTRIDQTLPGAGVMTVAAAATVAISGVTISGGTLHGTNQLSGNTAGGAANGGGINSFGELTLSDDDVSQNTATGGNGFGSGNGGEAQGGGVYNQEGSLTIDDSSFSQDTATAGSGGASGGSTGFPLGGAIENNHGMVTVNDSTFAHDLAAGGKGFGGAIDNLGTLTVEHSTIGPSNEAGFLGGGIETEEHSTTTIANTTIFDNNTGSGGGLFGKGTVSLASDTFDANEARDEDGNIGMNPEGTIDLSDTIIANGVATSAGTGNCHETGGGSGVFVDRGHNLETDSPTSQCGLGAAGMSDLLVSDAFLASALGANGGSTQTLALLPGAPEIGAGGACTAAAGLDQRGLPRPAACDIGAFQTQLPVSTTPPGLSGVTQVGHTLSCSQGTWTGDGPLNASDAVGALSFSYQWLRGGVAIAGASSPGYMLQAADGTQQLSCRVTATGAYGQASAVSATVAVLAVPTLLAPVSVAPQVSPQVSAVSQSASKWLESKLLASISRAARKLPVGTTFSLTLSQAASVVFAFTQSRSGRKVGKSCLAQTKHNAKKHRCTRTVTVATLSFSGHAGTTKVRFGGRVSSHVKLKPGRYTLVITATTSGKRSTPHSLSFTIATTKR